MADMNRRALGMAPLRPPANLTGALVHRLAEEIRSGRLAPGARLPTEQDLMREAGVSRTVVREAVAALRAEGLVITRQGVGAFVAENPGEGVFRLTPAEAEGLQQVIQVLELRLALEVEAAGLAAERRDEGGLVAIRAAERAFEAALAAGDDAAEADYALHRAIFAATANPHFLRFLEVLGRHAIPRRALGLVERGEAERRAYLTQVAREHRAVAAAIEAGDPPAARAAMRAHLEAARERYRRLAAGAS
jgi:GntR family transcriptional repressor for pyruvate dehydrogenase complex